MVKYFTLATLGIMPLTAGPFVPVQLAFDLILLSPGSTILFTQALVQEESCCATLPIYLLLIV